MSKKLMIGVAAGVAACVVVGLLSRRSRSLESLLQKIRNFSTKVEGRYPDFDQIGMSDIIPRGEDKNVSQSLSD